MNPSVLLDEVRPPLVGVHNTDRLRAVSDADLHGHAGDPDLEAVVATLQLACGTPIAVVNVVTPGLQTYPAEVGVGASCTTVPDGLSFCAEVVDTGRPLSVVDAANHPRYGQNPLVQAGAIGAYAGVPLVDDGAVLGAVSIFAADAREFTPQVLAVLRHQAQLAGSVLALRRSARTDTLTGLPNRVVALDRLDRLDRAPRRPQGQPGLTCVMYLDVDEFKAINDILGHAAGDEVLIEVGRRLGALLRPADTLARIGGDEFVVVCEDLPTVRDAEQVAERLVTAAQRPWQVQGRELQVSLSIGVAVGDEHGPVATELLKQADTALYRAKARAGSSWVLAGALEQGHLQYESAG